MASHAFATPWSSSDGAPGWHQDPLPTVIVATRGVVRVEAIDGAWVLPAQHAAWFPAHSRVRLLSDAPAEAIRIGLATHLPTPAATGAVVFAATPLLNELFQLAVRWGWTSSLGDSSSEPAPLREHVFATIAGLVAECAVLNHSFRTPSATSPELAAAMAFARSRLQEEPSIEDAARTAGISPRTLARRFREEAGTTWREFVHDARMLRAIELLACPDHTVAQTATEVGFHSMGAFTRAFVEYTGERPRDYHRRLTLSNAA